MAALESEDGMCDVTMKPKLLRSLLREYVPDERHPFTNPSELSYVVSAVKTHKLLYEWVPQPVKQDLVEAWKSAVDSWVHRLLTLASSNLPDKCWAGICLLGLTSQECCPDRFLTSYAVWFDKLLSCIQLPDVSNFVKAASCASLSDMLTRQLFHCLVMEICALKSEATTYNLLKISLMSGYFALYFNFVASQLTKFCSVSPWLGGFSSAKKDGNSHSAKIIQPTLKLLIEESSADVLVEAAIVSKIMSGICCASVLRKLAYGLSLLPKARGDEDSWCLMMDKIMLHINSQLTDAFQGLEEEARSTQIMRALLPSGKEPPPPLGGLDISEQTSDLSTRRPERMLGSGVSTLMQCCCDMLHSFYPVMVKVPVSGLVALAGRVLAVDGSLSPSSYSFMSTLKQEFIFSEIPLLQLHSLEILAALVKVLRSQLLPHAAGIVQLLVDYLRTSKFSDLKIKAYSIIKVLVMAMGIGTAIHISQDIVNNVYVDLEFFHGKKDGKGAGTQTMVHPELLTGSQQRKRKHAFMARATQEQPAHDHLGVENPHNSAPISLKIAALETLEALLTVGGSMRSERWRENVDHLLISVATNACKGGWSSEEKKIFLSGDSLPTWTDFQLAALRALLASLLSPGRTRPSHLALALHLFHRGGVQEASTKISEYCGHALLALEVLIHPRALPLIDSTSNEYNFPTHKKWRDTTRPSGDGQISTYHIRNSTSEPESEDDDDLDENWLRNNNEMDNTQITESRRPHSLDGPSSVEVATTNLVSGENDVIMSDGGVNMPESGDLEINITEQRTTIDDGGGVGPTCGRESAELELVSREAKFVENEVVVKSDVISKVGSTTGHEVVEDKNDERVTIVERISTMFALENELSDGDASLPDIVDGDPDSD
ncbi:proline [Striga asiatica]|uniref:Proline n=1 Tax=Striga asiatica TaxID=4170 RepID=A0A5A7Q6U2_STRAF|nr:proline [Striga asiatica]